VKRPRHLVARSMNPQPVPNAPDELSSGVAVRVNILAGYVRDEGLVAVAPGVENEHTLFTCAAIPVDPAADVETELEGHVEAGKRPRAAQLDAREVVNRESARTDDLLDLLQPYRARIEFLECTPRVEAAGEHREDECFEERVVLAIERAVDEDGLPESARMRGQRGSAQWAARFFDGRLRALPPLPPYRSSTRAAWKTTSPLPVAVAESGMPLFDRRPRSVRAASS